MPEQRRHPQSLPVAGVARPRLLLGRRSAATQGVGHDGSRVVGLYGTAEDAASSGGPRSIERESSAAMLRERLLAQSVALTAADAVERGSQEGPARLEMAAAQGARAAA